MPGLLHEAGLTSEAIAYCGGGATRVPLAQAYNLAARLGADNDPAGPRIFRSIEHEGPNDSSTNHVAGQEHDAAIAWTRAAALFLPLPTVIAAIRNLAEMPLATDRRGRYAQIERWERYVRTMKALIDEVAQKSDEAALETIDSALADVGTQLTDTMPQEDASADQWSANEIDDIIAAVIDLRICLRAAILSLVTTVEAEEYHLNRLIQTLGGPRCYASSMLAAAEILVRHGMADQAREMLRESPYRTALTVSALTAHGESAALDRRFRYWRLRYALAPNDDEVPDSVPPAITTPAGDDIAPSATMHRDIDAIILAARVDAAIRKLGQLDAAVASGRAPSTADVRAELVRLLDLIQLPASRSSGSLRAVRDQKPELMRIIAAVARRHGSGLPEQLKDELADRFEKEPWQWSTQLKLDLADDLGAAGVYVPWYREALAELESEAAAEGVTSRLDVMADLIHRHARSGDLQAAQLMVNQMIPMAFGIGLHKYYQFDDWVVWLGRALAEPEGDRFVDDAVWLARLVAAVEPMTEGAPRSAAASLPAAVVPASPIAAVRLFEYLVRQGTVQHFEALATLVCALVEHAGIDDWATIELAADLTVELLAPAADKPFPALASALVSAAEGTSGRPSALDLAASMVARTDRYALPTAREGWREGLGLGSNAGKGVDDDLGRSDVDDYFALVLSDGRRIQRGDVTSHIQTVDDIISLRRMEADDSNFTWTRVIEQQALLRNDVPKLVEVFGEGTKTDPNVLALLAVAAEINGDQDTAFRLAFDAFRRARGDTWARYFGGTRLRAASQIVRLGGQSDLKAVCQDLVWNAIETSWLPGQLLSDSEDIVKALDPQVPASSIWPVIRTYLDGMAETLALTEDEPLVDHGCRWWLSTPTDDRRALGDNSTHGAALAELAVGHLSHPSWLVREGASTVVVRALVAGNDDIAEALARFAQPNASDDTLERVGRCLGAARAHDGFVSPPCLEQLGQMLAAHPSQILRDLAAIQTPTIAQPLSPKYRIILPNDTVPQVGSGAAFPGPYEVLYKVLADELGLDTSAMLRVAAEYATESLAVLPEQDAVVEALKRSAVRHIYPSEELASSRAAAGRVLADVLNAGLLDYAPPSVRRLLRTVDIELVGRTPRPRPSVLPPPPLSGVDRTIEWWLAGIEGRLAEYIAAATGDDQVLIGASSRLTVLNWGHLAEDYECGTVLGTFKTAGDTLFAHGLSMTLQDLATPTGRGWVEHGEPLIVKNLAYMFHQFDADWLSFRPDLAAILGWRPDSTRPGRWETSTGDLAVQTIWWVDGWWGRAGPSFDDTEAQGYAVVLTSRGLRDLSAAFGEMTRHFALTRSGRSDGAAVVPISATQSLPLGE